MTLRAERESLVAEAERIIGRGSTSFRFASRLFDQQTRERAWLLYAWCRACDDLTDGQVLGHNAAPPADPGERVALARTLTERALSGHTTGNRAFDALALVVSECAIPRRFIDDHLAGFALDAEGWRPQSQEDLLRYCYHVAGAVGCMMAVIMGVAPDDDETLRHAADLGMAFQLANIARDLVEDDSVGRIYIPATWLAEKNVVAGALGEARHRADLAEFARRLAALAAPYEASARIGAERLPRRSRWAVLSAANIYGGIARKVIARGERAWDSRTVISKWAKLAHVARALR
jgi:phytoene synthase